MRFAEAGCETLTGVPEKGGSPDVRHGDGKPRLSAEQAEQVEGFLAEFLPRLKQEPGVREILHGTSLEGHDVTTLIVWESSYDAKRYRESPLINEPMEIELKLGLTSTRDGFAVTQHLS